MKPILERTSEHSYETPAPPEQFTNAISTGADAYRQRGAEVLARRCVHELFEQQATRMPGGVALISANETLTYGELNERANRLAHHLIESGVAPERLVGVYLERSFEMVVSLLAVFKAGGAYVPLDPAYPHERLSFMLADAKVSTLVTRADLAERLPPYGGTVISLDSDADAIEARSAENPRGGASEENLAYVIYTSGSTGQPKGVMVTHRGVPNLAEAQARAFRVRPDSRVLQFASMSFDASVSEIFKTLLAGAQLFVEPQGRPLVGPDLSRLLREHSITVVTLPPSVLSTLTVEELPALRTLAVAGDVCPPDLVASWSSGRLFLNAYGPTEITVCATMAECEGVDNRVLIGRPMTGTQVYVLDSNLHPTPAGEAGELCLGGVGLARGYLNRPELTAKKFVPDPYAVKPGARLYRTGDGGRALSDGQLDFLGRSDEQVKVRGFRIETGEVEATLGGHSRVKACAVAARVDARGEKQLIAYVVGESGREPEPAELRVYLRERLPEYMIPATFVALERLPLSPNGKIDRRALPAPTFTTQKTGAATAAPRGTLEELLARLWGEVLGTDDVGLRNNFFDIGGDSLKAAMLLNRLQEELGEVVYVVVLFDAPTIEGLAVYLRQHYVRAVARLEGRDYLPDQMTPAQKIDGEKLAYLRSLIKPLPPPDFSLKPKNPQAVFILSPPRSGSTLLRVMLAGNRSLFAPPELQLLCCNTLRDRKNVFTGRYSFWLEGTIRAFMDMKGCDAEQAARLMEECEERGLTTQEFYLHMQEELGARKKLVDKTPAYALDFETLKRAEDYFEDALYIHLLRHPNGMIRSFEDAKLDQIFRYEHTLSTRALAESIWTICHQNIVGFLRDVPARRQHVVRFEELVKQPSGVLNGICDFLGVEYDDAMAQPHREQEKKMTDGIHGLSRMLGDIKFHTHKKVDANIADRWKQNQEEDFLGEVTWEVATSLGYERPTAATAVAHANSTSTALHSKVLPPVIPLARKRRTTS